MSELQVENRPLEIEDSPFAIVEDDAIPGSLEGVEIDLRSFLLSVTGSEFLAYGEMVLR